MLRFRDIAGESGQTTIVAAVGLSVLIGFLGLGIDAGQLRYTKRKLQAAADAAALAAALEIKSCAGVANCSAMQVAAQTALAENGLTGATLVTNCDTTTVVTGLKLTVNNPACSLGAGDPNAGKNNFVEVTVSESQPTAFASVLGFGTVPLAVRAEAMRSGGADCMYALDQSGGNAITVDVLATVSGSCGIVDESTASNAMSCNLLAAVNVPTIKVAGGVESFLCGVSGKVQTNATMPNPGDPLASLPKPAVPSCGTSTGPPYHGAASTVNVTGNATFYADHAYCGGINILPGANVTFQPGVYSLTSGNCGLLVGPCGLTFNLAANVSGTGVTFYNYGPVGGVNFVLNSVTLGSLNLTAPSSGTYEGILLFQDPGNTSMANLIGSSSLNTTLQGAYYFPTARVDYALSGPAQYNTLVAYDIDFLALTFGSTKLTSGFNNNYSSLADGSPTAGSAAVLVQ